ncbi:MAG: hypothetical protein COV07_02350 [Candidatus Vogelbacteria bacterium CG10_big_fil_rev_8_21_14_0_10_45_14]|uniref:N-acetyltransferase domain-containing protein n=1 Tax=Candidatus Vogelbacteria bacterium CG10_big_fil_rev_8_21_14_0_10_45_14 TaxID=1975042 RepID=A0A2H0RJS7_9BACT|nr:MAG: hypothetical protein COV07_02350 [Candidatus Vogelbacteria bacterium CG10_big_fil_rev_8_21_14_0_10_45_14]
MLEITPETGSEEFAFSLPIYRAEKLARAKASDGATFSIYAGLHRNFVEQLRAYSLEDSDTELAVSTRDRTRFGLGSYESWYGKGRTPFALVADEGDVLAAIAWFGPKSYPLRHDGHVEGKEYTASFRAYKPYRGMHLMEDFSKYALSHFDRCFPEVFLWLETNSGKGTRLFQKLGFEEVGELSPLGKTVMIRAYCSEL